MNAGELEICVEWSVCFLPAGLYKESVIDSSAYAKPEAKAEVTWRT